MDYEPDSESERVSRRQQLSRDVVAPQIAAKIAEDTAAFRRAFAERQDRRLGLPSGEGVSVREVNFTSESTKLTSLNLVAEGGSPQQAGKDSATTYTEIASWVVVQSDDDPPLYSAEAHVFVINDPPP